MAIEGDQAMTYHDHKPQCSHIHMKYCIHCNVAYCNNCGKEFRETVTFPGIPTQLPTGRPIWYNTPTTCDDLRFQTTAFSSAHAHS